MGVECEACRAYVVESKEEDVAGTFGTGLRVERDRWVVQSHCPHVRVLAIGVGLVICCGRISCL